VDDFEQILAELVNLRRGLENPAWCFLICVALSCGIMELDTRGSPNIQVKLDGLGVN